MDKLFINTTSLKAAKAEDEDRTIEFVASKEIVDRGGDLVKIKGIDLKNYKKNPIVMWSHKHGDPPIGKAVNVRKTGDEIRIKVQFPTPEEYGFADTIYKLLKGKYINGCSVGIIPDYKSNEYIDDKTGVRRIINKCEFVELSVAPLPMNPETLQVSKDLMTKAIADGVIDDVELGEYELMCKGSTNSEKNHDTDGNLEHKDTNETVDEVVALKAKVAELELQLKEQEMESEEEDSIYKELYEEFKDVKKKNYNRYNILDKYL